ncbi:hypothetical protein D3C72_1864930 [compost metagenome]
MVIVDVQVAVGLDLHVDQRMSGNLVQHVVEEADTRRNLRGSGSVDVDGYGHGRFIRLSRNLAGAAGRGFCHQALLYALEPLLIRGDGKYPEPWPRFERFGEVSDLR